MLAAPARAQSVEEFYRGRTVTILVGFTAGGGYDLYARLLGPPHRPAHPGQSHDRGAEHAGRRLHEGHAVCLRRRRQGRPDARDRQPRHGHRAAAQRRQLRSDQTDLARHHHQRDERLRHLEDLAGQDLGRHVQARVQPRRQRGRRRSGHLRADPAQRVRRQGQARHRLSGRQRHQPRHGAPARSTAAAAGRGPA